MPNRRRTGWCGSSPSRRTIRARRTPAWTWRPATRRSRTGPAPWRRCGAPAACAPATRSRSSVSPTCTCARASGRRRSRPCAPPSRGWSTSPSARPCTCASVRSCAISAATRRARRPRSGARPSWIRWVRAPARWSRSTIRRAMRGARWSPSITRSRMSGARWPRIRWTCGAWSACASCSTWRGPAVRPRRSTKPRPRSRACSIW